MEKKLLEYKISKCPICGEEHIYSLVLLDKTKNNNVLLFGVSPAAQTEVLFLCKKDNSPFTKKVTVPPESDILGIATDSEIEEIKRIKDLKSVNNEFSNWVQSSRRVAFDFCKNMLTTSVASIPIYYAMIKFIENHSVEKYLLIIPPILLLLLLAICIFTIGIYPTLKLIHESSFQEFRNNRLRRLSFLSNFGTIIYLTSIVYSVILFTYMLIL
ncbi:MAG: hypothetical protein JEZ14_11955 [Marinilabiliaceae bacterium]|nr:hypothetical protein [Marinilabiliaceae bacterium]